MTIRFSFGALVVLLLVSSRQHALAQTPTQNQTSTDFGTHDIGMKTTPSPVSFKNPTNSRVAFTITLTGEYKQDYQIEKNGCAVEIAGDASCTVEVAFSPSGRGDRPAKLLSSYQSVPDAKFSGLLSVLLAGKGFPPELVILPHQILFPAQPISTSSPPQGITLTNNTQNDLMIDRIAATGDFQVNASDNLRTLKPGDSAVAMVSFRPQHAGNISGSLTIFSGARGSPNNVPLSGSTPDLLSDLYSISAWIEVPLMFILCFLYWFGMVVVRWNRVAHPTRELLKAQINSLRAELETVSAGKDENRKKNIGDLLTSAAKLMDATDEARMKKMANILFWSRGQEMTGWGYVHEAEVQMVPFRDDEPVKVLLETNEQQLRTTTDAPSLALADAIHKELASATFNLKMQMALLSEALNANYERVDNSFADLVSWQNKASWLVGCGLVTILVLSTVIHHHSILFLVGATGGLISRLSRSLDRKDVPTDYGASWTTLFLSPVAGALGAWAGILISGLAIQLNVLGSAFSANWDNPYQTSTLAIALLFGFSERLLDSVLDKLGDKADATQTAASKPQAAPATPPAAAGLTITTDAKLPDGKVGQEYTAAKLEVSGPSGNFAWSLPAGSSMPKDLQLAPEGKITGKPSTTGTFTFKAVVSDQAAKQSREFTITINP